MTPSEPSVEASEALAAALLNVRWPDGGYEGMPTRVTAKMIAASLIERGYVSPADHERAVRQAQEEGAAEALIDAAESLPTGVSHFGLCDWLRVRAVLARTAQPEDARGGEGALGRCLAEMQGIRCDLPIGHRHMHHSYPLSWNGSTL